jgi:glutathione peroxidase
MTILQKLLSYVYPIRMKMSAVSGLGKNHTMNEVSKVPVLSFYSLSATLNSGVSISFDQYAGKHILVVNLASNCGFTGQYAELEALYTTYKNDLVILGFPANDFGSQEPGTDADIAQFCKINYGVSFPLFKKNSVVGQHSQPVYQWLTDPVKNGWNTQQPSWNFCKYLIDKNGTLVAFFSAAVSPLAPEITGSLR